MRTERESTRTRRARRIRVLRIAWGDTIDKEVTDRVGDPRNAPGLAFWVMECLLADFRDIDAITEASVKEAVASACANWAGTPPMLCWEDFERIYPDWDSSRGDDAFSFAAAPAMRPSKG